MQVITLKGKPLFGGKEGKCFPADATARTPNGMVKMSHLKLGDQVGFDFATDP